MSNATEEARRGLFYDDRCQRYARQRGWAYDSQGLFSIDHLTPGQRRRALKKENHQLRRFGWTWS